MSRVVFRCVISYYMFCLLRVYETSVTKSLKSSSCLASPQVSLHFMEPESSLPYSQKAVFIVQANIYSVHTSTVCVFRMHLNIFCHTSKSYEWSSSGLAQPVCVCVCVCFLVSCSPVLSPFVTRQALYV
jgi:hypothetical protein